MSKKLWGDHLIQRARAMHGDKFDYSQVRYINAKTKIKIICSKHGEFLQTPDSHISCRNSIGCRECNNDRMRERIKSWPKYTNPGIDKNTFLLKCREKYGDKFIYDLENYNGMTKTEISITCPIHGKFSILPYMHLLKKSKYGCPKCGYKSISEKAIGGYSQYLFRDKPELKNIPAVLYYIKINDKIFKIGISMEKSFKERIKNIQYQIKINEGEANINIIKIYNNTLYNCFCLEQQILKENKDCRISKKWSTELFNKDIFENIIKYFN